MSMPPTQQPENETAVTVSQLGGGRSQAPIELRFGPGQFPGMWRPIQSALWVIHVAFGTVSLILILAILAAIPGLNILTLGYLVEPQRRVALSGRLRDGFPMLALAPRLGMIVFVSGLLLIPVGIQAARVSDASVILGAASDVVRGMSLNLRRLEWLTATAILLYIASTFHAAGKQAADLNSAPSAFRRTVRWFTRGRFITWIFRPLTDIVRLVWRLRRREGWTELMDGIENVLNLVQPVQHLWLGFKAFFGAVLWLLIPTGLVVAYSSPGRTEPIFGILSFLGVLLLIPVTAWLPQLQVHQAVTGKFRSIFSISAARRIIRNAPFSWMMTTILLFVMTFPLYLAKIRLPPADAMWLITPFFIVLTYPTRILVAWAYHRGTFKFEEKANFFLRWGCRLVMLPLLFLHAGFVFFTPAISELGKNAPLEHQAFLGPVPYSQWGRR
ncbi:MAG: hypothetical protein ACK58L_03680 [Planctomycetota bacterium]